MSVKLNNTYRKAMLNHNYGYALYEPQSSTVLAPGVCGYLDEKTGRFSPLIGSSGDTFINLCDPASLLANGLTSFNPFPAEDDNREWGPKVSSRVNATKLDINGNASLCPPGIPAGIGALYEFRTTEDFGAILLTKAPVVRKSLFGNSSFKKWTRQNALRLLAEWPDIKEHGLIIVTSTHATRQADINAWQDKSKKVIVGFDGIALGALEIAPSGGWYKAASDSGWISAESPEVKGLLNYLGLRTGSERTEDLKVVFFAGLYFKYNPLVGIISQQKALQQSQLDTLRSSDDNSSFTVTHQGAVYNVVVEEIGDGELAPTPPPELEDEELNDF